VLLKGWEFQLIWRVDNNTGSSPPFNTYEHPFTKLPYLTSHLCPQFAIFNAGFKLKQRTLQEQKDIINDSPDIVFVMDLYDAWTAVLPEGHDQDPSYNCPIEPSHENVDDDVGFVVDDDEDPDYDDKRRKRQKVPSLKSKRKRAQKVLSVPSRHQLISEITLSRLEQLGPAGWTRNMIRRWLRKSKYKAQSSYSSSALLFSPPSLNYN